MNIKIFWAAFVASLLIILGGCSFESGEGLLFVPKLPEEYSQLQDKIDAIISTGAVSASPETGTNRTSVQFIDLDGDSSEEVVAFFRGNDGIFRMYVYRLVNSDYHLIGSAEGKGTYIFAVDYIRIGSDGRLAVAVTWAYDQSVSHGLSVYRCSLDGLETILETQCVSMMSSEIYGINGADEILTVSIDGNAKKYCFEVFSLGTEKYESDGKVYLCNEVRSIYNVQVGTTVGNRFAVFIDSQAVSGGYVTDVITVQNGSAQNRTVNPLDGSGIQTWRSFPVTCADIDGDGIIEVPTAWNPTADENSSIDQRYRLSWLVFHDSSVITVKAITFSMLSENWYIFWPEEWGSDVVCRRTSTSNYTLTSFCVRSVKKTDDGSEELISYSDILEIYTLTSDSSLDYLIQQGVRIASIRNGYVYGYNIPQQLPQGYTLTPEQFKNMFGVTD